MPSVTKSTMWFVRITAPHEHCDTKLKIVKEWIDVSSMAIGYHIGEKTQKPHIHIALKMGKELQKQSVDVRFKTLFGVKGSDYSSKVWDGDHKVLSYLYHDKSGRVEFYKMELTESEKATIQTTSDVYAEIVKTAKAKASTRIPDRILEEMGDTQWSEKQIITRIYQGVRSTEWYDPGHMLDRYVNEILLRSSGPIDYVEVLASAACEKRRMKYY